MPKSSLDPLLQIANSNGDFEVLAQDAQHARKKDDQVFPVFVDLNPSNHAAILRTSMTLTTLAVLIFSTLIAIPFN
jgi:hypothetical protein